MTETTETPEKETQDLTLTKRLPLQRKGTSDFFRFPAEWKELCKLYHVNPPILEVKLQKNGRDIQLIGTLVKEE